MESINYSVINSNGICVNHILWDGQTQWNPPEGCIVIPGYYNIGQSTGIVFSSSISTVFPAEDPIIEAPVVEAPVVTEEPVVEAPVVTEEPVIIEEPVVEGSTLEEMVADGYNPDARDGDGDGIVQEGTEWERPVDTTVE